MLRGLRLVSASATAAAGLLAGAGLLWWAWAGRGEPPILPPAGETLSAPPTFQFAVLGDSRGNMAMFERILDEIRPTDARFILHGGDIVKRCQGTHFNWVLHELHEAKLKIPFCPVPGNHDIDPDARAEAERYRLYGRAFGPRRYWFACGNALFVAFDAATETCSNDDLAWLDRTLDARRKSYQACFVYMHMPLVDPRPGKNRIVRTGRQELVSILARYNVTAVFCSHIHAYLEGRVAGIPVFITGGAGVGLHEPWAQFHYLLCTVDPDGSFRVQKFDVSPVPNDAYLEYVLRTRMDVPDFLGAAAFFAALALISSLAAMRRVRR